MTWQAYHVRFRLCSPMHIGNGKTGNLQRSYSFVTGRVFWGALAMRITRSSPEFLKEKGHEAYRIVGEQIHNEIAFTYFYPTLRRSDGTDDVLWPWHKPEHFRRRVLRGYASTALSYPAQSAEEASLHETEFISPWTIEETPQQVFLTGYVFIKEGLNLKWRPALERLQFGGERSYGWGDVYLEECSLLKGAVELFNGKAQFVDGQEPIIRYTEDMDMRLFAHTKAGSVEANGNIEPLVGREWRADLPQNRYAGQYLAFHSVCFTPGSRLLNPCDFRIGKYGVWEK